ncbi:MAG: hypothetical protein V7K48_19945 [Nostoc sp.]|uniref:hypothetical protein n=1 Tax=Nostoc sp. TaxID=1180 RepID=UPI002FF5DDC9
MFKLFGYKQRLATSPMLIYFMVIPPNLSTSRRKKGSEIKIAIALYTVYPKS